jgi:hypothetical protein
MKWAGLQLQHFYTVAPEEHPEGIARMLGSEQAGGACAPALEIEAF